MPLTSIRRAAVALVLLAAAGCTVKSSEPPPLTGPSGLALTLTVNAIPDSISQDGGSQSSIKVTAIGPNGKPLGSVPIRVDMMVNGVATDFGTLSARSIVTNSDGVATVIYTAPPSPTNGAFGTCSGLPGNCVSIVATATATNFVTANPQEVQIRLVPTGVILPPASLPTAVFTMSPTPAFLNVPVTFDASGSTAGAGSTSISSYSWNFGDGTAAGTGKSVTHTFTSQQTFNGTLTVTNDRGLSASTPVTTVVGTLAAPTPRFVFSPAAPQVGQTVVFNADQSTAAVGHTLTTFNWNFGDGATASGFLVSHAFATAGTYNVVLSVADDTGQKGTTSQTIAAGAAPASLPTPNFTISPAAAGVNENVFFNASTSTAGLGHTIASYAWTFGDGGTATGVTATHPYSTAGTYSVQLKVTDEVGQSTTSASTPITIGNPPVPTAAFTFSPALPAVNQAVTFDASQSRPAVGPGGQPIVSYLWSFGDNTATQSTASPTFSHTYGVGGAYSVTLVVRDGAGRVSAAASASVTVASVTQCPDPALPCSTLTISQSPATVNLAITLTAQVSSVGVGGGIITNFQWDFGDGTPQIATAGNSVSHTYTRSGTFTAKVTLTNSAGRQSSSTVTILVQ